MPPRIRRSRAGQGLLPLTWNTLHGHNLLHEYLACPERFYFFTLTQLAAGLSRVQGPEAELVVLLGKPPGALAAQVDARQFALFSTPVVNLFERRTDRIALDPAQPECHLVPDRSRPLDFEVHAVQGLTGQPADGAPYAQDLRHLSVKALLTNRDLPCLVLEHCLARHVSINVFTQTVLESMQRGTVATWPVRMGGRGIV